MSDSQIQHAAAAAGEPSSPPSSTAAAVFPLPVPDSAIKELPASSEDEDDDGEDDGEDDEEEDGDMDFSKYQAAVEHLQQQQQLAPLLAVEQPLDRFGLHKAAQQGDLAKVKLEVERRGLEMARLGRDAWHLTPIFTACVYLQLEVFQFLLPVHFPVDDQQDDGMEVKLEGSPLIHVVLAMARITRQVPLEMLKSLLEFDPTQILAEDEFLRSPLRLGIEYGLDVAFIDLLLDASAVGVPDLIKGFTCLHVAATALDLSLLKTLLQRFGDEESINVLEFEFHRTLLHLVCIHHGESGRMQVLDQFQALGGLVDHVDDLGKRAEDYVTNGNKPLPRTRRGKTLLYSHASSLRHYTCVPKLTLQAPYGSRSHHIPPENVNRLKMLLDPGFGALNAISKQQLECISEYSPAEMSDVLRVHEWAYLKKLQLACGQLEEGQVGDLDGDTGFSQHSFTASLFASGALLRSVDRIVRDQNAENAFCCVRPPGHHAGPNGITEKCTSHGFCLVNNVAVAASYAMNMYRDQIKRVAIIDFDVHHGNGTETCVDYLNPENSREMRTMLGEGFEVNVKTPAFKPWLSVEDQENVLFCSVHGFGGGFYPGSGRSTYATNIMNHGQSNGNRMEWRRAWSQIMFPRVREFQPDLIFVSAGFDAHTKDDINCGLCGTLEHDYEWITQKLVCIANECCEGRIISALEGGYRIHGMVVSAFSRSVVEHVNALAQADPKVHQWDTWQPLPELGSSDGGQEEGGGEEEEEDGVGGEWDLLKAHNRDDLLGDRKRARVDEEEAAAAPL
ncbi:hypothetical protein BASA81_005504 [Batrachochytrium salamandrivorans]|nr:hypothetical protein BASA81_005504 [Batrachochytrium salamandrivorans]